MSLFPLPCSSPVRRSERTRGAAGLTGGKWGRGGWVPVSPVLPMSNILRYGQWNGCQLIKTAWNHGLLSRGSQAFQNLENSHLYWKPPPRVPSCSQGITHLHLDRWRTAILMARLCLKIQAPCGHGAGVTMAHSKNPLNSILYLKIELI